MKYLIVISCLLVVAYGIPREIVEKIQEQVSKYAVDCKGEVGTSDDDLAPFKAHESPNSPKGKCFVACMHKKFGFQDASGKIDKDATYSVIEKIKPLDADLYGKMLKVTDVCVAEVTDGADECETAFNMYNCVSREQVKLGIPSLDI